VVNTRGAGLGLAIVSEFAASMGGHVRVAAADSGGARFIVSYPLADRTDSSLPVSRAPSEGTTDVLT
jgi:K+-sensing histidine kinase KdpD